MKVEINRKTKYKGVDFLRKKSHKKNIEANEK